ncbi:hypothetical protein [Streptomyces bohaiensis]|uniref:hypothetical protein n=1 Tax=Streptomyces bohaiensis TaxID=1431344 RepID=UPI001ADD7286|nr:hypothetical protein [Streptomyces bohaiensis]
MAAAGRAETGTTDRVGLRLFTRAPVTPRWLARTVVPAARSLRDGRDAGLVHIRRGWLHGPHIEFVARPFPGQSAPDWPELADRLDAGPAEGPGVLDEERYLAQARETGRLEGVEPPYLPMREHGAVEYLTAADLDGWPQPLLGLREMALDRLTGPVLTTVEGLDRAPQDALTLVGEAFVALAAAHPRGAAYGVFSLRSHAEAFLAWAAPVKDPRPSFARRLEADTPRLRPLVEAGLAGRTEGAAGWGSSFAYCMGGFDYAVAQGQLTLEGIDSLGSGFDRATMGPPGSDTGRVESAPSAFHRTMDTSGALDTTTEWFASYRLLVNLFYQQLPLLCVPPMHRYYFCYAVAELVDRVLGTTWQERIETATGSPAPAQDAAVAR